MLNAKEICKKFNEIEFHDSKLLTFKQCRIEHGNELTEELHFDLELRDDNKNMKAELVFKNCRLIKFDMDLVGKRYCGDDILAAECKIDSDFKKKMQMELFKYEKHELNSYLHFKITLIPPGGELDILAEDFEMIMGPQ